MGQTFFSLFSGGHPLLSVSLFILSGFLAQQSRKRSLPPFEDPYTLCDNTHVKSVCQLLLVLIGSIPGTCTGTQTLKLSTKK